MFADAASQILSFDPKRRAVSPGPYGGGAKRRVDGNVRVTWPQEAMPSVLATPDGHERAVATADRATLVPVGAPRSSEHAGGIDRHRGDRRRHVELL
jgi:hypothetical protein